MGHIFISYSSRDKQRVEPIVEGLRAGGHDVWWDADLEAGADFRLRLEEKVQTAEHVVLIWTANASKSRWVHAEAEEGASRNALIPLRLDDTKLPLGLRAIQMLDFRTWDANANSKAWADLTGHLERKRRGSSTGRANRLAHIARMLLFAIVGGAFTGVSAGACLIGLAYAFSQNVNFDDAKDVLTITAGAAMPVWLWSAFLVGRTGIRTGLPVAERSLRFLSTAAVLATLVAITSLVQQLRVLGAPTGAVAASLGNAWVFGTLIISVFLSAGSLAKYTWGAITRAKFRA